MQVETQAEAEALVGQTLRWNVMGIGVDVVVRSITFEGARGGATAVVSPVSGSGEIDVHCAWMEPLPVQQDASSKLAQRGQGARERVQQQAQELVRRLAARRRDEDPPEDEGGSGVRSPRYPASPNLGGAAAVELPDS